MSVTGARTGISRSRGLRRGATLLEIAFAVGILAVVAAVVYPSFASTQDRKRVTSSIAKLRELTIILNRYDTLNSNQGVSCAGGIACDRSVGRYPRALSHLVDSIRTTVTNNTNSCNTAYVAGNVTGWRTYGPFWNRDIAPGVGFRIPVGLVRDQLIRTPATAAVPARSLGTLQIQIDSMLAWDLREMEMVVDGNLAGTTGTVQYSGVPNADSIHQPVYWTFPIGGC